MNEIKTFVADDGQLKWEISEFADYFHVNCKDPGSDISGSGFSMNRDTAKKIAFSELNERHLVEQLKLDSDRWDEWGLGFDNSCSGFAVGYDQHKTVLRSICEGAERWALSKWIDEGFALSEVDIPSNYSKVTVEIMRFFDFRRTFVKVIPVLFGENLIPVHICAVICSKASGVFAGYGAKLEAEHALQHAHIESLRNYLIFKNQIRRKSFPFNRIFHFAVNTEDAERAISSARKTDWPAPALKLSKSECFNGLWLARTIFEGWEPWQKGSETRFLY